jgi:hypothetical protein
MLKKSKRKRKVLSDRYMGMLWRKAVLSLFGNRCIICNNMNIPELECHHIVKRRKKVLKYEIKNGVPVCKHGCHSKIDSLEGLEFLKDYIDFEYLKKYENVVFKQYLTDRGMTENEFLQEKAAELKEYIKGVE